MAVVLCVPDLHSPFLHPRAFEFVRKLSKRTKPDEVVFLGDELDAAAWSKHPKNPSLPGPQDELEAGAAKLRPFFQAFPRAKVCWSNHVARLAKRAAEAGISARMLRNWSEMISAPTTWAWADEWQIDGVCYRHGDGFSGKYAMRTAPERLRQSVVFGHLHGVCGVSYLTGPRDTLFGAAMGCLIDPTHEAFDYAKHNTNRPVLAAGVVYDGKRVEIFPLDC